SGRGSCCTTSSATGGASAGAEGGASGGGGAVSRKAGLVAATWAAASASAMRRVAVKRPNMACPLACHRELALGRCDGLQRVLRLRRKDQLGQGLGEAVAGLHLVERH